MLDLLLLIGGGLLLYFGAEWLVEGAAGLARLFGVPPLVVGLTIVSYGTSAPELAVSLVAALEEQSAIVLGNVTGSNIANIGLILGLTALIAPPHVEPLLFRREVPYLLVATLACGPVLLNGQVDRYEGVAFVLGAATFTLATFRWAKDARRQEHAQNHSADIPEPTRGRAALFGLFFVGLATLVLGGRWFVTGAVGLAQLLGMSERMVGLTIVAFGTSVPELAASLVAALRGHSDIAVGNVVGSNLFNILLILGVTALISPVQGNLVEIRFDLIVMTALTFFLAVSLHRSRRVTRWEGGLFCAGYVGFLVALVALG